MFKVASEIDVLDFAKKIAREAGEIMKKRNLGCIQEKTNPSDLLTEVDIKINDFLIQNIQQEFPDHAIISEEKPFKEVPKGYTWVIDPVDGTLPYAIGFDYSAILIALMKDRKPVMGVIYQPFTDACFYAEKGKGAFLNGEKITVSRKKDISRSVISLDYNRENGAEAVKHFFLPLVEKIRYVLCFGCAGMSLVHLAKGDIDGIILDRTHLWDIAAGYVIVKEAGGEATNIDGFPLIFDHVNFTCLFSNGTIHEKIIHELKEGKQ